MESFSFRIQDVFRLLLPGNILIVAIVFIYGLDNVLIYLIKFKDFESIILLVFIIFSVLSGYLIDIISSLFEKLVYYLMKRPSYHFINGTIYVKIFFSQYRDSDFFINEESVFGYKLEDNKKLSNNEESKKFFNHCNRLKEGVKDGKTYEKLNSYFYSKILSRNMTIMLILIYSLVLYSYFSLFCFSIGLFIILLSLYRWLKLSFNYTRQIFIICETLEVDTIRLYTSTSETNQLKKI